MSSFATTFKTEPQKSSLLFQIIMNKLSNVPIWKVRTTKLLLCSYSNTKRPRFYSRVVNRSTNSILTGNIIKLIYQQFVGAGKYFTFHVTTPNYLNYTFFFFIFDFFWANVDFDLRSNKQKYKNDYKTLIHFFEDTRDIIFRNEALQESVRETWNNL